MRSVLQVFCDSKMKFAQLNTKYPKQRFQLLNLNECLNTGPVFRIIYSIHFQGRQESCFSETQIHISVCLYAQQDVPICHHKTKYRVPQYIMVASIQNYIFHCEVDPHGTLDNFDG